MSSGKSSVSQATSYAEIGEFWDTHSIAEFWDQTELAPFEIDIRSDAVYYPVMPGLSEKLHAIAKERGVPAEKLLNEWVQEKAAAILTVGAAE